MYKNIYENMTAKFVRVLFFFFGDEIYYWNSMVSCDESTPRTVYDLDFKICSEVHMLC